MRTLTIMSDSDDSEMGATMIPRNVRFVSNTGAASGTTGSPVPREAVGSPNVDWCVMRTALNQSRSVTVVLPPPSFPTPSASSVPSSANRNTPSLCGLRADHCSRTSSR